MDKKIAQTRKGPVEYTLLGSGPVILVCHGTSSDCTSHEGYEPLLSAGFSILTPSRPGYGRTPLKEGATAAESADLFMALQDNLDIKSCFVLAVSGGGPTGIALAANFPRRVRRLVLIAALTRPEGRASEPAYKSQVAFYGPMHGVMWGMLGLMSRLSPRNMARQTMAIFSAHDPKDALDRLTPEDIKKICLFYQHHSSRVGALNDLRHTVGKELLQKIKMPTLVIHSREDKSVPFSHAEWATANIPRAELCEGGFTGHFYWVGSDYQRISRRLNVFLKADA
jgi:pimeloyl-ACP methyl ester carboxylesterase